LRFSLRCCWGFTPSGMWRRVAGWVVTDVSKERDIFLVRNIRMYLPNDTTTWRCMDRWRCKAMFP
jgi:hypothetical protein